MVRRLKKDVLKDLPAKRRQIIEVPLNGFSRVVKAEAKAEKKWDAIVAKAQKARDDSEDKEFKTHIKTGILMMPTGRSRTSGSTQVKGKPVDRPLLKPVRRAVNVKTPKKGGY